MHYTKRPKHYLCAAMTNSTIKQALYDACQQYVNQRLQTAKEALAAAREAAAEETKSSAGDKYETGRAMAQIEEERALGQLAEANRLNDAMQAVRPQVKTTTAEVGSLVVTETARYYLAVSVGKVSLSGVDYFVVSPASPIGQVLLGAQAGDAVQFQGRSIEVKEVG